MIHNKNPTVMTSKTIYQLTDSFMTKKKDQQLTSVIVKYFSTDCLNLQP